MINPRWFVLLLLSALAWPQIAGKGGLAGHSGAAGGGAAPVISVIQSCVLNQTANSTTMTITCGSPFTAGNTLIVGSSNTANGGTWTGAAESGADTLTCATVNAGTDFYCYGVSIAGGGTTIVITNTNSTFCTCMAYELHNTATSSPLDNTPASLAQGSSTTWTGATSSLAAKDILFLFGGSSAANNTYTAGSGYTLPATATASGGNQSGFAEYQIFPSSGNQTPTVTLASAITGRTFNLAVKVHP
jgi:hypothetical protein